MGNPTSDKINMSLLFLNTDSFQLTVIISLVTFEIYFNENLIRTVSILKAYVLTAMLQSDMLQKGLEGPPRTVHQYKFRHGQNTWSQLAKCIDTKTKGHFVSVKWGLFTT